MLPQPACIPEDCTQGPTGEWTCESWDDEAGNQDDCGWMANDRGIVVMVSACSTIGSQVKELGFVPLTQDAVCTPARVWDCMTILETVDNPFTLPVQCGYCEEYDYTGFDGPVGIQPASFDAFQLCYPPTSEWEASTLQGRIGLPTSATATACKWIESPIGFDTTYEPLGSCWRGVSCLYIDDGCGCRCRDVNGSDDGWPYVGDYFGGSLVDGWEITCSGEPLVWHYASQSYVGTTTEPDGFEPNFPPNNEAI